MKYYRPTSPGIRQRIVLERAITDVQPTKSLLVGKHQKAGRDNKGQVSIRHRGGGNKKSYRIIDFKRDKINIPATVKSIEYDPNRSAFIALVIYKDGEKRYILAPLGLEVGQSILSGEEAEIKVGNSIPLGKLAMGTVVHNVELKVGKGGQIARAAGSSAQLLGKDKDNAVLKLKSGEIRLVNNACMATVGQVGNADHQNRSLGKAGIKRHLGWRPTVKGSVMNPCDHPHGGGEGGSPIGQPSPRSPWGKKTLGKKTRVRKNSAILRRRNEKAVALS